MTRKLVWIKGNSGSGKSTIPIQMLQTSKEYVEYDDYCTVFHRCQVVAAGKYIPGKLTANGCDQLKTVANTKAAIEHAIRTYPTYSVIFEGMMISTIKTTFYEFMLEMGEKYDIELIIVVLKTTAQGCINRLATRGTSRKPPKRENMERKNKKILSDAKWYEEQGKIPVEYMDMSRIQESQMMYTFHTHTGDVGWPMYAPPYFNTYKDVLTTSEEGINLRAACGYLCDEDIDTMDLGQKKRAIGGQVVYPSASIRNLERDATDPYAPWDPLAEEGLAMDVGYVTGTKKEMSLLVQLHLLHRLDIPLLTEYEHLTLCKECKGSSGTCPGFAPRFDTIKPKTENMYVITVTMDYAWAIENASLNSWYMCSSYIDAITSTYIARMIKALHSQKIGYVVGAHNCPGKCKPCAVIQGKKCKYPSKRVYSMEATGVDCDALHHFLFGEYLPWAHKYLDAIPLYMTRYAGVLTDGDISEDIRRIIVSDKTYIEPTPGIPEHPHTLVEIPSGPHKGKTQYMYNLEEIRE